MKSGAVGTKARAATGTGMATSRRWHDERATARLHRMLITGDAIALLIGFAVPLLLIAERQPDSLLHWVTAMVVVTAIGLWAVRVQGLWVERVQTLRAVETSRIARALLILSAAVLLLDRKSSIDLRAYGVAIAASIAVVVVALWRAMYRAYVNAERKRGRLIRRVVLIGDSRRAAELRRLFGVHPELGMLAVAVIGNPRQAKAAGLGHLWKGEYKEAERVLDSFDNEVVVLCSPGIDSTLEASLTRVAHTRRRAVFVDPGVSSFDIRRFQAIHLAYQPLLEVDSMSLPRLHLAAKRTFDVVVSAVIALVLAIPLVVLAVLIKLEDRGPVLFRQTRVGQHGKHFTIFKFRTMVVDAERRLAELESTNERRGPLFKMERDPRVTRVGRLLRATSLDELPQLYNVLTGTMSLVGPRPALPSEVEGFPAELKARHQVRPGITGLWQVEARDNPSFDAYRRLDLFYVENWSLVLDLVIMLGTLDHFLLRPLVKLRYRGKPEVDVAAAGTDAAAAA